VSFPYSIYATTFMAAFGCAILSVPVWRLVCRRAGLIDDPGDRKIHDHPVILAGGLAVLTGMLVPLIGAVVGVALYASSGSGPVAELVRSRLGPLVGDLFAHGLSRRAGQLLAIFAGAGGMVSLGLLDDRHELRPSVKFAGQLIVAFLVALSGVRITLFVDNPVFSYAVTILWILTVTNACNFMDNMNGLCTGLGIIGSWAFAWTAAAAGQFLVATIAFLACGALLGFLPFNFPRASAFLGDAGSHLVGYLLAILAILPHFYSREDPGVLNVLKPILILGVILGDLVWVVWIRWRLGKPFYIGDTNHLSHRLVRRGLSRTSAVLLIWFLAAVLALAAMAI
jgi:UDP-GlcNAc:undecaprenyl-phosphate/decaprenyl-phosphate GlcNAc-1-phosphate transferase